MRSAWNVLKDVVRPATAAVACTLAQYCAIAQADPLADFYSGKTITIIVGSEAGGGYDTNARVMAQHLGQFIPGKPQIVVQNMPGAGSIVATNYVYNIAPKDGTVIGLIQRGSLIANIVHQSVQYQVRNIPWIGNLASEPGLVVAWYTAPQKSIADVMRTEFVVGGSGVIGDDETIPRMLNAVAGTKFKIISGYPSVHRHPARHGTRRSPGRCRLVVVEHQVAQARFSARPQDHPAAPDRHGEGA